MKYSATLALAATLAASANASNLPQCNPALHCPSISMECFPCNPRTDDNCSADNVDNLGQGHCVEPARLSFDGKVYSMKYNQRCRRIVDVGYNQISPEPAPRDYVKSCREGQYTCNDGRCINVPELEQNCDAGFSDAASSNPDVCNLNDPDTFQMVSDIFANLDHDSYCANNGGVRFGPFRCNNGIVLASGVESCENGEAPKMNECVEIDFPGTAYGPSDACHAECSEQGELFNIPGCCVPPTVQGSLCSPIKVYSPEETIDRCTEEELTTSGCDVCKANNNGTPGSNQYPYCCMSEGPAGSPVCVDDNGLTDQGASTSCSANNGGLNTDDVCYVDSSGSDAQPPAIADDGSMATGIELTFKMDPADDINSSNDCCCDVVCACFGDPHCTSFFADYEVSQENSGEFVMVEDGAFSIKSQMGKPLGVNENFLISLSSGDEYVVNAKMCVYDQGIIKGSDPNGDDVIPFADLDSPPFTYVRTGDRPNDQDTTPYGQSDGLNEYLQLHPTYLTVVDGLYTTEIKCIRFEMLNGKYKGWWSRMDVTIKRSVDDLQSDDGCCPRNDAVYDSLIRDPVPEATVPTGFCFRHPIEDEDSFIPGAQDLTDSGVRRLGAAPEAVPKYKSDYHKALEEGYRSLVAEGDVDTVERFANAMHIDMTTAAILAQDFGIGSLANAVAAADATCHTYASDSVFDIASKTPCDQGLVLQAKKPSDSDWIDIKFFPAYGVMYCNDKITVLYDHTMVGDEPLTYEYELRLTHCTVDPSECPTHDTCMPSVGVKDIGVVKHIYDSSLSLAFKDFLETAIDVCSCVDNPVQCIQTCVGTGHCPDNGC